MDLPLLKNDITVFLKARYLRKNSKYPTISVLKDTLEISAILKDDFIAEK
jgi:hypothetical protein